MGGTADGERPCGRAWWCVGRHQDGDDDAAAAGGVEVLEIQRVVFDLGLVGLGEGGGAGLELQHQDGARGGQHGVDPAAQAAHRVFEHDVPGSGGGPAGQGGAQAAQRDGPGAELGGLVGAEMLDSLVGEAVEQRGIVAGEEVLD